MHRFTLVLACLMAVLATSITPVAAAVTTHNPACTTAELRAAFSTANTNGTADIIVLPTNCVYTFSTPFETTTDDGNPAGTALPSIRDDVMGLDLTIRGNGAIMRRDPGAPDFRLLRLDNQAAAELSDLAFENGRASQGGAIYVKWQAASLTIARARFSNNAATASNGEYGGGAIMVHESTLAVRDSTFEGNTAAATSGSTGGAIRNLLSDLTIANSTFRENQAAFGGALYIDGGLRDKQAPPQPLGTPMVITGSNFSQNRATKDGGAIYRCLYGPTQALQLFETTVADNQAGTGAQGGGVLANCTGTLLIDRSTISGNRTGAGGGGLTVDKVAATISNSTIANNQATDENSYGGGIWLYEGSLHLESTTLASNSAVYGGGIANSEKSSGTLHNTIVSNTATNPSKTHWNCMGPQFIDKGGNIEHPGTLNDKNDGDCTSSIQHADPALQALADNGGETQTMALSDTSPARNRGTNPCSGVDQRGFMRIGICDSGAFEQGSNAPPNLTLRIFVPLARR